MYLQSASGKSFRIATVALLALWVLFLVGIEMEPTSARSNPGSNLQVKAPQKVEVGEPIKIEFFTKNVRGLAGYEVGLNFDKSATEFNGLTDLKGLNRGGNVSESLGAVESPKGVGFGGYSCSAEGDCGDPSGGSEIRGVSGSAGLGVVSLIPNKPGQVEISLGRLAFVDAAGKQIRVRPDKSKIVVRVGSGNRAVYRAPAENKSPSSGKQPARKYPYDLTGDGRVTYADVMDVVFAWERQRSSSSCQTSVLPGGDVNRNGCVGVGDIQMVASNYRETRRSDYSRSLSSYSLEGTEESTPAPALTVNSTGDEPDAVIDGICETSKKTCTLRAAISEANARAGSDRIHFGIPGSGVKTIRLASSLPTLSDETGQTVIDGYTQAGASPNTHPLQSNARLTVEVIGSGESSFGGIFITSADNVVRGLSMYRLRGPVTLRGTNATSNALYGNFIGTDALATHFSSIRVNGSSGVNFYQGASDNLVGGTAPAERNVISGNALNGVGMYDNYTERNVVQNNIVGLSPDGSRRLSNKNHGVDLNTHTAYSTIGGLAEGERNVFSGNTGSGVEVSHGGRTTGNEVVGNFIGTDLTGTSGAGYTANDATGLNIEDGVRRNLFSQNVIGGSLKGGVNANGYYTSDNTVTRNRIGISLDGTNIGNKGYGVRMTYHANGMIIGPGNIITNNATGVEITGDPDNDFNRITRNSIYGNVGLGIDLARLGHVNLNDRGDADSGPNDQLNFPEISGASIGKVTGTVCPDCTVEVFIADDTADGHGEGRTFVGSAVSNGSGDFEVQVEGVRPGDVLTSTATDPKGNTSEFSKNIEARDVTAPDTVISEGSEGLTSDSKPTFAFSGSDDSQGSLTFSYRLDNESWSEYSPETSKTFTEGLPDGRHVFSVRARDAAGNVDETPSERAFDVDTAAPVVESSSPAEGEADVGVQAVVKVRFSEKMRPESLTSENVFLRESESGGILNSDISYDPETSELSLDPVEDFTRGRSYTVTVRGGAGGAKDIAGNPIAEDKTWSFTAEAEVQPPPEKIVFSENWTQTNGSSWDQNNWRVALVNAQADILSDQGRLVYKNIPNANARVISKMTPHTNTEVLMSFQFASNDPRGYLRVFTRASGDWVQGQPSSGYYFEVGNDRAATGLRKVSSGSITEIANGPAAQVTERKQWLRLRVEGNTLQARVWTDGEKEPENWELRGTDDSLSAPGVLQMRWGYSNSASAGGHTLYMDDLTVRNLD